MTIHTIISDHAKHLNDSEVEILDYCIKNAKKISNMKIKEVADELFTSPASLVRFCKKLGFNGFSEFKATIKMEASHSIELPRICADDFFKDIQTTIRLIDETTIEKIIHQIHQRNRLDIYAVGSSRVVANQLASLFQSIGINAFSFEDSNLMNISASNRTNGDLVIAISISGETKLPLKACNIAKENGALIVSVTNIGNNTLSRNADYNLYVSSTSFQVGKTTIQSRMEMSMLCEYLFFRYVDTFIR
ncbi:MAG: MurR/RpiR family transcriptional regulator [Bacillota bacterium]|nr:MurR/RpiR family transcriptional regulator [Bacillota bacterium]